MYSLGTSTTQNIRPQSTSTIRPFEFVDIQWQIPDRQLPELDRRSLPPWHLTPEQWSWRQDGVLHLKNFIPHTLIDAYKELWRSENKDRPGGWPFCSPYMDRPVLRDLALYPPLMRMMKSLIGFDMGLHLNLTGFTSTRRRWHSDVYLNPDYIGTWYIAAWIALDAVSPDAGPFEFVRGSHKWGATNRDRLWRFLPEDMRQRPSWPSESQDAVAECVERELERRHETPEPFLGQKGDVLLWHGALIHQGSVPKNPALERQALICHYSAVPKRIDMPLVAEHKPEIEPKCYYFLVRDQVPTS